MKVFYYIILLFSILPLSSLADPFTLWTTLDSEDAIENPPVGPAGIESGSPSYEIVQCASGVKLTQTNGEYFYYPASIVPGSSGAIEFWLKPNWGDTDSDNHNMFDWRNGSGDNGAFFYWRGGYHRWSYTYKTTTNQTGWEGTAGNFNANSIVHILIVWDADSNINGCWSSAGWQNGGMLGTDTGVCTLPTPANPIYFSDPDWGLKMDGVIDQLKVYDDYNDLPYDLSGTPFPTPNYCSGTTPTPTPTKTIVPQEKTTLAAFLREISYRISTTQKEQTTAEQIKKARETFSDIFDATMSISEKIRVIEENW